MKDLYIKDFKSKTFDLGFGLDLTPQHTNTKLLGKSKM